MGGLTPTRAEATTIRTECKRDRTESKLKSYEVAGGKELCYEGMKLQPTPNRTTSNSSSSFHSIKLPVDTKVFASKLLKKFRAFSFASFAFPSISIHNHRLRLYFFHPSIRPIVDGRPFFGIGQAD